jgi:DNA replication and repair protein RecF
MYDFRGALEGRRADELVRRISLVGPQRDDLVARIGDGAVKRFASQGQHRSFVLALKIAEMEVHRAVTGDLPPLLLDDVASELDPERNRRFFEYVQDAKGQVFITTTRPEDVKLKVRGNTVQLTVRNGTT